MLQDGPAVLQNKENVQQNAFVLKDVEKSLSQQVLATRSPLLPRTPLSDINSDQSQMSKSASRALRRARYSFITPVSTPQSINRTGSRSRRSSRANDAEVNPLDLTSALYLRDSLSHGKMGTPSKTVPLNALVYKKLTSIVEGLKQEHEVVLSEKNGYIQQLELQLRNANNMQKSNQEADEISVPLKDMAASPANVAEYVKSIIEKAVVEVSSEKKKNSISTTCKATSPITFTDPCNNCKDSKLRISPNQVQDAIDTSNLLLTPLRFKYTEGKSLFDDSEKKKKISLCAPLQFESPEKMNLKEKVLTSDAQTSTNQEVTDTKSCGTSPMAPDSYKTISLSNAPIKSSSVETMTSPLLTVSDGTMVTPLHHSETNTMTDVVFTESVGTSPISVRSTGFSSSETMVTPIRFHDMNVMTQRITMESASTSPIVILGSRSDQQKAIEKIEKEKLEYQEHYYSSQNRISELEVQLKAFTELRDLFSKVQHSQLGVQTTLMMGFQKMSKLTKDHQDKTSQLHISYEGKLKEKDASINQLEQQLLEKEFSIKDLEGKIDHQTTDLLAKEDLLTTNHQQFMECEMKLTELSASLQENQEIFRNKTTDLESNVAHLEQKDKELLQTQEKKDTEIATLEQERTNLLRTLESREGDLDAAIQERDKMSKLVGYQKTIMETLRKDLQKKQLVVSEVEQVQQQLQLMQQSSKETQEFLEEERSTIREELITLESALASTKELLTTAEHENLSYKEQVGHLNGKCQELEGELDETKARAHLMLLQQNGEISESLQAVSKLLEHLRQLQTELDKCTEEQENAHSLTRSASKKHTKNQDHDKENKTDKKSRRSTRKSFVCSILDTIREPTTNNTSYGENDADDKQGSPEIQKPVIGTSGSAFVRVRPPPQPNADNSQTTVDNKADGSKDSSVDTEDETPLYRQVEDLDSLLVSVSQTFRHLYSTVQDRATLLQNQVEACREELEVERAISSQKQASLLSRVDPLEREIRQMTAQNQKHHQQLLNIRQEKSQVEAELRNSHALVVERTERMEAMAEQLAEVRRDGKELEKLKAHCRQKDQEIATMRLILDENMTQIKQNHGEMTAMGMKELVRLKKQNAVLEDRIVQQEEKQEAVCQKMARRMEVYKSNWEKAERELGRLDDLVERIRQAASHYKDFLAPCTKLQKLLQELGVKMNQ